MDTGAAAPSMNRTRLGPHHLYLRYADAVLIRPNIWIAAGAVRTTSGRRILEILDVMDDAGGRRRRIADRLRTSLRKSAAKRPVEQLADDHRLRHMPASRLVLHPALLVRRKPDLHARHRLGGPVRAGAHEAAARVPADELGPGTAGLGTHLALRHAHHTLNASCQLLHHPSPGNLPKKHRHRDEAPRPAEARKPRPQ